MSDVSYLHLSIIKMNWRTSCNQFAVYVYRNLSSDFKQNLKEKNVIDVVSVVFPERAQKWNGNEFVLGEIETKLNNLYIVRSNNLIMPYISAIHVVLTQLLCVAAGVKPAQFRVWWAVPILYR